MISLALGLSYPFHDVFYVNGGMGTLFDGLLKDIEFIKNLPLFKEYRNILPNDKISFLADPIIHVKSFKDKISTYDKTIPLLKEKKYFMSVGRLTRQKNYEYLIKEFKQFLIHNDKYELLIFGEGEERKKLKKLIKKNNLENKIKLMGYCNNVFQYMRYAQAFILSSLWEDPGFVLIEAAMCNLFIISSNCKNGPEEILKYGEGGFLYQCNKNEELKKKLEEFLKLGMQKNKMKLITKKIASNYTLFRHHIAFEKILN